MRTRDVVLAAMGGLAVGMIAGILLAPDKGSETRRKLVKQGNDLKDDVVNTFDKWSESVTESVDHLKAEAEDLIAQATRKYRAEKAKYEKVEEEV